MKTGTGGMFEVLFVFQEAANRGRAAVGFGSEDGLMMMKVPAKFKKGLFFRR